jgi:phage replication-related protein YjqB (UPF0714/DUF867 family)
MAAAAAAACAASLYTVEQPPGLRWHVPSNTVDPALAPALADWLSHVEVAIALHGYGRIARPRQVLLGGTNRQLAAMLARELEARLVGFGVVDDLTLIPVELRGLHPANPVNRPPAGGVQLELPPSARGTSPNSDGNPPIVVDALVAAVREWETTAGLDGSRAADADAEGGPSPAEFRPPVPGCKSIAGPVTSNDTPSGRYDT